MHNERTIHSQLRLRSTGTPSSGDTADTVVQLSTTPDTKAEGGALWYMRSLLLRSTGLGSGSAPGPGAGTEAAGAAAAEDALPAGNIGIGLQRPPPPPPPAVNNKNTVSVLDLVCFVISVFTEH